MSLDEYAPTDTKKVTLEDMDDYLLGGRQPKIALPTPMTKKTVSFKELIDKKFKEM